MQRDEELFLEASGISKAYELYFILATSIRELSHSAQTKLSVFSLWWVALLINAKTCN